MAKIFSKPTNIPGFPGYKITKGGDVFSSQSVNKILKPHKVKDGHLQVTLYVNKIPTYQSIHRLVLKTFVGPCPNKMMCRHLDGNPENNNLSNLCWGSHQDNEADKDRMGRRPRGSKHGGSKLTEQDVRMIIYMCSTKLFSQRETADIYGVCIGTVNHIIKKRNWRQIWTSM